METLKNFFTGFLVIFVSLILFGIILLAWPLLVGLSSLILSIIAAIAFVVLIFYIIVLIGHLVRSIVFGKSEKKDE